jgi:hypothetical protein
MTYTFAYPQLPLIIMMETQATTYCCLKPFWVGIPLTVGFRPKLVVVSGLSVGIPLTVGFRPQLVVVSGLSVGIPLTVGFRISRSLRLSRSLLANSSRFHYRILASTKPFTRNFSFFTMESWLSRSLSHGLLSFFTVGSRLSWSLFANFSFTWCNLGYHGAFTRIFLSHGGISAITEPFSRFFFLHMVESRLSRSLYANFSFTWWDLGYHGAFFTSFSFTW